MSSTQNSTLVLDTSVLPKRPKVSDVQKFMAEKLKLDLTLVKRIQVHNLKNIVRLGMTSLEVAEQVASKHHLKHFMECDETQIPVPIYVESSAVDVRAFDLPEDISNEAIRKFFEKYGEVISIRNEVWRNFFPGLENGVKVLKMRLIHPIPSIVTVEGESTLIEYKNQPKTGVKPKTPRCFEAQQTTSQLTPRNNQQQLDQQQWPPLSPTPTESNSATKNQQQNNNVESHTKRQRSVEENSDEDQTKKTCIDDPNEDGNIQLRIAEIIARLESEKTFEHIKRAHWRPTLYENRALDELEKETGIILPRKKLPKH